MFACIPRGSHFCVCVLRHNIQVCVKIKFPLRTRICSLSPLATFWLHDYDKLSILHFTDYLCSASSFRSESLASLFSYIHSMGFCRAYGVTRWSWWLVGLLLVQLPG